jgi:hypothetical protein
MALPAPVLVDMYREPVEVRRAIQAVQGLPTMVLMMRVVEAAGLAVQAVQRATGQREPAAAENSPY